MGGCEAVQPVRNEMWRAWRRAHSHLQEGKEAGRHTSLHCCMANGWQLDALGSGTAPPARRL